MLILLKNNNFYLKNDKFTLIYNNHAQQYCHNIFYITVCPTSAFIVRPPLLTDFEKLQMSAFIRHPLILGTGEYMFVTY